MEGYHRRDRRINKLNSKKKDNPAADGMSLQCSATQWEAVTLGVCVWLFFAVLYGCMHWMDDRHFGFTYPYVDPLYFSISTTTAVGYGDLTPKSATARAVVVMHQLGVMGIFLLLVCTFTHKRKQQ